MSLYLSLYQLALAGSVVVAVFLAGVGLSHKEVSGAQPLTVLMLAVTWWSLTRLVGLLVGDPAVLALTSKLTYLGIVVVPVAWVVFAIQYTGRLRTPSRLEIAGLHVVPALVVGLIATNEYHHLIWRSVAFVDRGAYVAMVTSYGPAFWVWTAYAYVLLGVGTALVLETVLFSNRIYRDQAIALGFAMILPWTGNVLFVTGVTRAFDLTSVGFVLSGVVLTAAVFRRQLLAVVPVARQVAREEIMDAMNEAVFVVDEQGTVVDLNPSACDIIGRRTAEVVGQSLESVLGPVADLRVASADQVTDGGELTLSVAGDERTFDARVAPLDRGYGTIAGHLITLRDVTERRGRERRIERQRQRLEVVNRVLRHDIRNAMNVILGHAEELSAEGDDAAHVAQITEKGRDVVELGRKAREIERVTAGETLETSVLDVVEIVDRAVADLEESHPEAAVRLTRPDAAPVQASTMIDSAIRNVVENAVEHNDRAEPTVTVTVRAGADDETVAVTVADDGPGLPDHEQAVIETGRETALQHSSGLGLWLVYWIVGQSGGEVTFSENEPRGSVITIRLPAAAAADGAD